MSIAACLTARALNIGYGPIVKKGVEALEAGGDVVELQTLLGHASLDATRRYATAEGPAKSSGVILAR